MDSSSTLDESGDGDPLPRKVYYEIDEEEYETGVLDGVESITSISSDDDLDDEEEDEEEEEEVLANIEHSENKGGSIPEIKSRIKIHPAYDEKFRPGIVQTIIQDVTNEILLNRTYAEKEVEGWITTMCQLINSKVKELNFPRYKFITHVVIGELRGQAAVAATKCVWDEDADYFASYSYTNNTLFCNAVVYGVYYY